MMKTIIYNLLEHRHFWRYASFGEVAEIYASRTLRVIAIIFWGVFMAVSMTLYHICYMVDFSKVKNIEHAGKEIAFMNVLEKISIGISPIIGGAIALWFGLQVVLWIAALLFAISALPLFWSVEPVKTHQKIELAGFPWANTIRTIIAQAGVGFDLVTSSVVWSMFIVIVVFPGASWDIYVTLGLLSSVTILADLMASYTYGKLIDTNRGGSLLRISAFANGIVHMFRPFVRTPALIVGINISNEAATTGYTMSFMRGVFDTADLSGHRILYLCISDVVMNFGSAIACATLLLTSMISGDVVGMKTFFFVAAGAVLLIGTANFSLYRNNPS